MRVLILGGTVFLSKAVAQVFLARGHDVTWSVTTTSGAIQSTLSGTL